MHITETNLNSIGWNKFSSKVMDNGETYQELWSSNKGIVDSIFESDIHVEVGIQYDKNTKKCGILFMNMTNTIDPMYRYEDMLYFAERMKYIQDNIKIEKKS